VKACATRLNLFLRQANNRVMAAAAGKDKKKRRTLARRVLDWPPTRFLVELHLRVAVFCVLMFGPRWAYFWGRRFAGLGWCLMPRLRKIALRNVDLCLPQLPPAERTRIARSSFNHAVYTFIDIMLAPRLMRGDNWKRYIKLEGDCEAWARWQMQPEASFNMSAHFGNWEFLLLVGGILGKGFSVVMRQTNLPLVTRWLVRYRTFAKCEPIDKDGALKALLQRIRDKKPVALLADQNGGDGAPELPFFGVPACWQTEFTRLLPRASGRYGFGWTVRHGDRFEFTFHAPVFYELKEGEDPMSVVERYRDWLEARIREHPEQYMWVHRRFKSCPRGAPDRYRELGRRLNKEEIAAFIGLGDH
jgi:KDO2-lipid IV(A) lauroyltransferase